MTTQLVTTSNLPAELANLMQQSEGLIQVRDKIIKPLRIKLVQAMSKSAGGLGNVGDFVCESSGVNFGNEITVIPLMIKESASLMYSENKQPSKIPDGITPVDGNPVCYTTDLITNKDGIACKHCPWGEYWSEWRDNKPPKCNLSIDLVCIPEGTNSIMVMQFRRSSHPSGTDLVNKIAGTNLPPFLHKYTLKSKDETQDKYRFKIVDPASTKKTQLLQEEFLQYVPLITDFLQKRKARAVEYDVTEQDEAVTDSNSELPI